MAKDKKEVLHINYANEDGKVYCRKAKSLIDLHGGFQIQACKNCPFFRGTAQGEGVECQWEDSRPDVGDVMATSNPEEEYSEISRYEDSISVSDKFLIEKLAMITKKSKEGRIENNDKEE